MGKATSLNGPRIDQLSVLPMKRASDGCAPFFNDTLIVPDAPAIRGLTFRHFRGVTDFPHMMAVIAASALQVTDRAQSLIRAREAGLRLGKGRTSCSATFTNRCCLNFFS